MSRTPEKPALIEKCDELGIEYKSTDSIADLKGKIADKIINPDGEVAEVAVEEKVEEVAEPVVETAEVPEPEAAPEEAPVESVEETPESAPEPEEVVEPKEPAPSKFIPGKFVENAPVMSANLINGLMEVRTPVATYKMSEEEYENLKAPE